MLYVKLKKESLVKLQAALTFQKLLSNTLKGWGFRLNEYNQCVDNKNNQWQTMYNHMSCRCPEISHVNKKSYKMSLDSLVKNLARKVCLP